MSKVTPITSTSQFNTLRTSSTYLIVDFYADWCGPCKTISPIFETLATSESKPPRLAFCKVNVDTQREIAATYGVSAMPTFLVLKGSAVVETIRGANPAALRTAVLSAAASAGKGSGASFGSGGRTLGGEGGPGRAAAGRGGTLGSGLDLGRLVASPAGFAKGRGWAAGVVRFVALYLTTLLSFEPVAAAEGSPFSVKAGQGSRVR